MVFGACLSLGWLVHPYYEAGIGTNDGAMYILSAKSLLAGQGYSYLGQPFTIRPPGMSVLLAPLIAWRGFDFFALNLFVSLFGVAGVALLFVLASPRVGTWLAFSLSAALWLNPAYRHFSNQVMSDVPGVALLLACLIVERWAGRRPELRREIALGVLIALATYVRTIDFLVLPAILVARAFSGGLAWRRCVPLAATACALLLPWSLRNAACAPQGPVDQNFIASYSTGMWHVDPGDPASPLLSVSDVLGRIPARARQVLSLVGGRMRDAEGTTLEVAIGGVLLALAFATLLRKRRASEFLVFGMCAVLAVYFGFQDRLVLPILVLALPAAIEAIVDLAAQFRASHQASIAVAALVLGVALFDFAPRAGWEEIGAQHRGQRQLCDEIAKRVPKDARLAASVGWHYSVLLDRPVYSLRFAVARAGAARGAESVIDRYHVDAIILTPSTPLETGLEQYFGRRKDCAIEPVEGGTIVRILR